MVSSPRPAWAFFVIFCLLHKFARTFFQSALGFFPAREMFRRHFVLQCPFSSECEDTSSVFPVFLCIFDTFRVHPDIAVANLSRPIPSRMARNVSKMQRNTRNTEEVS